MKPTAMETFSSHNTGADHTYHDQFLPSGAHQSRWPLSALLTRILLFCLLLWGTLGVSRQAFAVTLFATDATTNNLVRFDSATPGTIVSSVPITGLTGGETVLAIDFRPANNQLFALGSTNRLYTIDYTINPTTAIATPVGNPGAFTLNGTEFGFDFNPTVDRIRVVSNTNQDLRLNPNDGTLAATDTPLAYAAGDVNAGADPDVVGSAYTNSINGATTTTLYGIDVARSPDVLVTQNPPNAGTLNTVGSLGVNATAVLGFDIRGATNTAFATLVVGGTSSLYLIDLTTGAATLVGPVGAGLTVRGLAVAPEGFGNTTLVGTTATFNGSPACDTITFDQSGGLLRHNRFSAGDPGFNSDFDFDPTTLGDQTLSATDPAVTIIVNAGGCDDQTIIGSASAPASGLAASFQINGQGGGDTLTINDTNDATARTITLNGSTSTITGLGGPITYGTLENLLVNAGTGGDTINVQGTSAALTSINAGGGADTVVFGAGATLSGGLVDGGAGSNTLDYSAYTTPVTVDLSAAQAQTLFLALLTGAQEPGPLSNSPATGQLVGMLNAAQTALTFNITYQGLTGSPISGTHFHNQIIGVNGPIVRGLFPSEQNGLVTPSGTFAGVWSNSDPTLDPPASTAPIRPLNAPSPVTPGSTLVQELLANRIYFNIHTLPNFPSGEIRGQLINQGLVNPATGTGGVRGFDNVTGGSNNDTLTGNANVNVLRGGPGNDTIVGGQGGDQLFGDANDDTLIWNNGDGSDFMEGGTGNDTVVVNGSPSGNDQFLVQINPADPTRLRFDRTNLGLFNLNIGTTEQLTLNPLDGDNTVSVLSSLSGTAITVNGGNGNDALTVGSGTIPGATLDTIDRALTFNGGPGNNTVTLDDSGDTTGDTVTIDPSQVGGPGNTLFGPGGSLLYSNVNSLTLNASNGASGDTINVVPSTTTTFSINGNNPTTGSGDTLVVDFTGTSGASLTLTPGVPGSGQWAFVNRQPVNFSGIESLNPTLQFSASNYTVNENAGTATITVTRSGSLAGSVSVTYATEDGTATAGSDYTPTSGSLVFAAGETTKTFTIPIINDALNEPNETVNLTLSNPLNNGILGVQSTAVLTIVDDDALPSLTINDVSVTEGNSGSVNAVFTVTLSAPSAQQVTVDYLTANGTATQPGDYQAIPSSQLIFSPGQTSRTVTVAVNGDTLDEANETFFVNLSNATNATIADGQGSGTIVDDDGSVSLSINDVSVTEGNSGTTNATFTVTLSAASGLPVTVNYATASGSAATGDDFIPNSGTLTFNPGTTSQTINVLVQGDTKVEGDETFFVNLSNPVNATLARARANGTILNEDQAVTGQPTIRVAFTSPQEGQLLQNFPALQGTMAGAPDLQVGVVIQRQSDGRYFTGSGWGGVPVLLSANVIGGTFSFAVPGNLGPDSDLVQDGLYRVNAVALDAAGHRGDAVISFFVDQHNPTVSIDSTVARSLLLTPAFVTGHVGDGTGSGVQRVDLYLRRAGDGKWWNGTDFVTSTNPGGIALTTLFGGRVWARRTGLPTRQQLTPGVYRLLAKAYDRANRTAITSLEVRVTGNPNGRLIARVESMSSGSVGLSGADAKALGSNVSLRFGSVLEAESAGDAAHYQVTVNGKAVPVESASYNAGTRTVTLDLAEGSLRVGDNVVVSWSDLSDAKGQAVAGQTPPLTVR